MTEIEALLDVDPAELKPISPARISRSSRPRSRRSSRKAQAAISRRRQDRRLAEQQLGFDFDTVDFDELVEEMGILHDSAFRADFNNPNDKKKLNSGIKVYDLSELVQGLIEANVPQDVIEQAEAFLSAIPDLPGGPFEMSGDDDDPLQPAKYHGVKTGLTIHQRSYTVGGNEAVLLVHTIENTTPKILPLVQAAALSATSTCRRRPTTRRPSSTP